MNHIRKMIYFLLSLSFVKSLLWNIEIKDSSSISNMNKGLFYEVTVDFKADANLTTYLKPTFKLKSEQNAIRTLKETYSLDLSKENSIQILIGSPCDTAITESKISFVVENDSSQFKSMEYIINLMASSPFQLSLRFSSLELSKGEYGVSFLSDYPRNVDPLEINYKSSNQVLSLEPLKLPTYNPNVPKAKFNAKYSRSMTETIDLLATVQVSLATPSTCFALSTSSFEIQFGSNTIKDTKQQKVSFKYDPSEISSLIIAPSGFITPSMLYCVLVSIGQQFPSKADIINQDYGKDTSTFRYFQGFLYEGSKESFVLKNLNKVEKYKLKCIYQNSANEAQLLTTSSFSSSTEISILPKIAVTSYCATWFVDKPIDKGVLETTLLKNCNEALISLIPLSKNGCLECLQRPADDLFDLEPNTDMMSICIGSNPTCLSSISEQNLMSRGDSFVKMGKELGKSVYIENLLNIRPKSYTIKEDAHTEKYYNFTLYNVNSVPGDCKLELLSLNKPRTSKIEFKHKMAEKKALSLVFPPESYDDDEYTINVFCKLFPNFPYSSTLIQYDTEYFNHNITIDCNKNSYFAKCVPVNLISDPKILTDNPKQNITDAIASFETVSFQIIENFFLDNLKELVIIKEAMMAVKISAVFGELMTHTNCSKHPFNACRSLKKNIIKEIIPKYTDLFPNGVVIKPKEETESLAKLFVMGLMYSTMNIDGYSNQTSRDMLNYVSFALNQSTQLIEELNKNISHHPAEYINNAKTDMMNMYYTTVDNLLNLIEYLQRDEYLLLNHSEYSIINPDEAILQFKYSISGLISSLIKYFPSQRKVMRTNYDIHLFPVPVNEESSDLLLNADNVKIILPTKTLVSKAKAKFVAVILYKKHPLLAFNNTNVYHNPIISIDFFDSENKPIPHQNLPQMDIKLSFDLKNSKSHFAYCYHLANWNLSATNMGISEHTETSTSCVSNKLEGDILIGIFNITQFPENKNGAGTGTKTWIIVVSVVVPAVIIIIVACVVIYLKRKKENDDINISDFDINDPITSGNKPS